MKAFRRLRAWWQTVYPCWTECYPEGWRSIHGVGMTCDECNRLHDIEWEMHERRAREAQRLATRPEYV